MQHAAIPTAVWQPLQTSYWGSAHIAIDISANPARDRFPSATGSHWKGSGSRVVHRTCLRHEHVTKVLIFSLPELALPAGLPQVTSIHQYIIYRGWLWIPRKLLKRYLYHMARGTEIQSTRATHLYLWNRLFPGSPYMCPSLLNPACPHREVYRVNHKPAWAALE